MTTYKDSGVDIAAGDKASKAAYAAAAATFASRKGMIGAPVFEEGGFGGLLDMGDYYLVMTDDGTGTKIDAALEAKNAKTLGYDLLAMVADDAVCTGAEVIAVSNTIDIAKVDATLIKEMMEGLSKASVEQKIVIPAGEIAEVPGSVKSAVWSATAIGIVAKDRLIDPKKIAVGDTVIALKENGARSNGFSLIRKILRDKYGTEWWKKTRDEGRGTSDETWGNLVLTPSTIYHTAILALIGRYGEKRSIDVKGISHITGGGIPSKFRRILKKSGLGAKLDQLWTAPEWLMEVAKLGKVESKEQWSTWCMGNGMLIVVSANETDRAVTILNKAGAAAQICGTIVKDSKISVHASDGSMLDFSL